MLPRPLCPPKREGQGELKAELCHVRSVTTRGEGRGVLIDYARLLARGIGGWLQFERACSRSGLFGEKYLAHPIGQILSAGSGNRARAEYKHPTLAHLASGPGRRPEVDFAVCEEYPKISLAVESKWIGQTRPSVQSVLWDLIRLELLAHHEGARCFFILGGKRSSLESYFAQSAFSDARTKPLSRPLLRHDSNVLHRTFLVPVDSVRISLLKGLFEPYQRQEFAHKFYSRRTRPFPEPAPANGFQVYVWEILAASKREVFKPQNSPRYRVA